jgi:hypothetical protein
MGLSLIFPLYSAIQFKRATSANTFYENQILRKIPLLSSLCKPFHQHIIQRKEGFCGSFILFYKDRFQQFLSLKNLLTDTVILIQNKGFDAKQPRGS